MLERNYQSQLIKKLKRMFPNCVVLKNDSDYMPGIPDLLILYKNKWAMLEVKASEESSIQPNQEYYVLKLDDMSFASFINPTNEEEVLVDLQHALKPYRSTRLP